MYSLDCVKLGVSDFLEEEFLSKIKSGGIEKILLGTFLGIAIYKSDLMISKLKENPIINFFEIIDKDNRVDVDLLENVLRTQIPEEGIELNLPMVDNNFSPTKKTIVFHKSDVDKLAEYIKRRG